MRWRSLLAAASALVLLLPLGADAQTPGPLAFHVTFDDSVRSESVDGRVFVIVSTAATTIRGSRCTSRVACRSGARTSRMSPRDR